MTVEDVDEACEIRPGCECEAEENQFEADGDGSMWTNDSSEA